MDTNAQIEALYRFRYPDHDFDWLLPDADDVPQVRWLHHAAKKDDGWHAAADLTKDLNAMREFELLIAPFKEESTDEEMIRWGLYRKLLNSTYLRSKECPDGYGLDERFILAPAVFRLEAMVRALALWKDRSAPSPVPSMGSSRRGGGGYNGPAYGGKF
jgi:hypothetical protein